MHYRPVVVAPKEIFASEFRPRMRGWQSWSISQALINQRYQAALRSMRETNAIISQTPRQRSDSRARLNHAWSKAFRDETFVENTQNGAYFTVRPRDVRYWIDSLNEGAGQNVWREMPTEAYPVR
jgi:hypothetical protein